MKLSPMLTLPRDYAASMLGTMKVDSEDEEFLYTFCVIM